MQTEILLAGFGGQGIMFAGQLLAYAAMDSDKNVTWIPSYGPEMRGGTANCTVIISDDEIGSPNVRFPQAVMIFNLPSLAKYEAMVAPGGVIIVNQSLINRAIERQDVVAAIVPAIDIAESLGEKRLMNMVMLGALLKKLPVLPLKVIEQALEDHMPDRHKHLLPLNVKALQKGADYVSEPVEINI